MLSKWPRGAFPGVLSVLLAGCQKFGVGTAIRFSAETRLDAAGTKAAYSDVVTGGKERIDWKAGDQILLAMKNDEENYAQQAYNITGITAEGFKSKAGLEADGGGSGLEWGTGDHYFWAAYPSSATLGTTTITGTIADTQTQRYSTSTSGVSIFDSDQTLYLTAGKLVKEANIGDPISLDFDPAMTTFDFEVGSNTEDDMMIRNFEMTTVYAESEVTDDNLRALSGNFTATYDAFMVRSFSTTQADDTPTDDSNRNIKVNFDKQPAISQTKKVRFRVMALPQDIKGITIVFETTETDSGALGATINKTHKLRLKQTTPTTDWITFDGCGKANITGLLIPGAEWKITFSGPRIQQWTVYDEVVIGVE